MPTPEELDLFIKICKLKDESILSLMESFCKKCYKSSHVIRTNDYVYAHGDIPIALVAHADTVHAQLPKEVFFDRKHSVVWSPEGIGADDRAGIYAIIDILKDGYRPTVIICNKEEKGGKGARKFIKDYPKPLSKINFMLELDRRGQNDMVFYDCDSPEFETYLEPYGFVSNWGSFSDISIIAPMWNVAAANLSIGYEDEHTEAERLYFYWMFDTIQKVKNILDDEKLANHPFIYIFGNDKFYYYYKDDEKMLDFGSLRTCDFCNSSISDSKTVPVYDAGQWFSLCPECADQTTEVCVNCGKRFFTQFDGENICPDCRRKLNLYD